MYVNKTKITHALYVYLFSETTLLLEIQTKEIYFQKAILNQCPFLATKVGKKNSFSSFYSAARARS